jgi:hypothetical protein
LALGVGASLFYQGYSAQLAAGGFVGVIVLYLLFAGVIRSVGPDLSVSLSGSLPDPIAKAAGKVLDEEFEVPLDRLDQSAATAPRRPTFAKDESTMCIGASRSGKTSALKTLASQIDHSETAIFAHGSAQEYPEYFREDLDLEVVRLGVANSTHHWNLFRDCQNEHDLKMISKALFGESDDYFRKAARQVFAAILIVLEREDSIGQPSHRDAREAVMTSNATETYEKLSQHADLKGIAQHIDPSSEKQQTGVWSSVTQTVDDVFTGDFAQEGSFSIREYLDDPSDRAVVIESPEVSRGTGPMYRVLLDEVINRSMKHSRDCFLLLDEIDTLPALDNLSDLAARGLAQDCRMLLGIQTVGQLRDVYGKATDGVIGNTTQVIGFAPGNDDGATVKFYQSIVGERRDTVTNISTSRRRHTAGHERVTRSKREKDRLPLTEHTMNHWEVGEGLISTREHWWIGKVSYHGEIKDRYLPNSEDKTSESGQLTAASGEVANK